jgi:hypothetical protein
MKKLQWKNALFSYLKKNFATKKVPKIVPGTDYSTF